MASQKGLDDRIKTLRLAKIYIKPINHKNHNRIQLIICVKVNILSERYDPYKKIGLKSVINAATALTTLGGSIPKAEVFEAMQDASRGFIVIPELQKRAG